jgi:hypothetical protein
MHLSGLAFFAVSFALVRPTDPYAFYHQRYVLPGLPLVLAAIPLLIYWVVTRLESVRLQQVAVASICLVLIGIEVAGSSHRHVRLANDARNIDDVQVRMGKYIANASDTSVLWAVDAGATRFFGNAFVVDLIGLNTPEMLTENAQAFLDAHQPTYIDVFPMWSSIDDEAALAMGQVTFETTTPYTVTGFPMMRSHSLAICSGAQARGDLTVRKHVFAFTCAAPVGPPSAPEARPEGPGL